MMEKLFKQLEGLVIKWKDKFTRDEFLRARLKLTFFYSLVAFIILLGASILIYQVLISNIDDILEETFVDPLTAQNIVLRAGEILEGRIIAVDFIVMFFVILFGFWLTHNTLKPIKLNLQKQKKFIADASHELKTPISVVISGLEVAMRDKHFTLEKAKTVLANNLEEMRDLSKLNNTLLEITKIQIAKSQNSTLNLSSLIAKIVDRMSGLIKNKNIILESKINYQVSISGNEMEIGRVFYNILDNALAHTEPGGYIKIKDKLAGDKYIVEISDSGSGISKNNLEKVFDPFFQADDSRNHKGVGLGLTLVKQIMESHMGSVSIQSELGRGTVVSLSFKV